jgi:hypothetical protein
MGRDEKGLPPSFSLLRSEFNDFLFAPIGEETNHASLTVLSALSRQGLDPWHQADGLSRQSREVATQRMAAIIADLPDGSWNTSDALTISARLVALLPRRPSLRARLRQSARRVHATIFRFVARIVRSGPAIFDVPIVAIAGLYRRARP